MHKQKWKICKKLMAVILTLCMMLPLISNQYLVVRAEESETGTTDTKKLSDLIAAGDYVSVDLTKGEDVTLTDQTWTTEPYEYVDSLIEDTTKVKKTGRGSLYQVKLSAGQTLGVTMDLVRELRWYKQDSVDTGYSQGYIESYYAQTDEIIYLWVPYNDLGEETVPDTYTISFILGKKVSQYKEKAAEITLDQKVTFDTGADNYLKNVTPNNWTVCDGWLYKTSLEDGYYTLNLDKKDESFMFEFYPLDQNGNYKSTSEVYYNINASQEEQLIFENGYIFIANTNHAEGVSISLDTAKTLSDLEIPELSKGKTYTSTSADSKWRAGEYGYNCRMYKISLKAGEMVNVVEKGKDGIYGTNMYEVNEKRFQVQGSVSDGNAQSMTLNNDTNAEKVYYIGINPSNDTDEYTIDCTEVKLLADSTEKAVAVTENAPITFEENDARLIVSARYNTYFYPQILEVRKGAYVTFDVPAKTSAMFKLKNDTSYKEYYVYEDMSDDKNYKTVSTSGCAVTNSSASMKAYYVWIPEEQAERATVSLKLTQNTQLSEVPELQLGDNLITTDTQVVEYKNYAGESEYWNGHVYQFTVPEKGTYAIGLKYTGSADNGEYYVELTQYEPDSEGRITGYSSQMSLEKANRMNVLTSHLENGRTYYFKLRYDIDNTEITEPEEMQDITIFIKKDVPEIEDILDTAKVVTGALEEEVSNEEKTIVEINSNIYFGKLYQITIPADCEQVVKADSGRIEIYELKDGRCSITSDYLRTKDALESSIKGVVQNNSDGDKTYYVFETAPFSKMTFEDIKQQTPATPIESADIAELNLTDSKLLSDLSKQKLSLTQKNYYTGKIEKTKKECYWLKFTVPENKVYALNTSYSKEYDNGSWSITTWNYSTEDNVYISGSNRGIGSGYYNQRVGVYAEGTYYVAIEGSEDLLPIQFSLSEMPKIEELKDKAVEITDAMIQAGSFSVSKLEKEYAYLKKGYTGSTYDAGYGNLMKIKVPKHTTYMVSDPDDYHFMYLYEEDFKEEAAYGSIVSAENTTDTDKTYYIWQNMSQYDTEPMTISVSQVELLSAKFATAEKLEKDNPVTYQYNESDPAYTREATFYDGSAVTTYKYAKMYYLDAPGFYSLHLTSKQDVSNVSISLLEKEKYRNGTYTFENNKFDKDFYLADGEKTYILLSQDSEKPDAEIQISVSDVSENRILSSCLGEAESLKDGKTTLSKQDEKQYVFKCKSENPYTGDYEDTYIDTNGKLYKYEVAPWSSVDFAADTFQGRIWMFDEAGTYITYDDVWNDIWKCTRTNDSDQPLTFYLMSVGHGEKEGTLTITTKKNADKLASYADQAIALPDSYTTTASDCLTVKRPTCEEEHYTYTDATGKLYLLTVPAKSKVEISATKNAKLAAYNNLDDAPAAEGTSSITFSNLANDAMNYYLWIEGSNDGVVVTTKKTPLESKTETTTDGESVETIVDQTETGAAIVVTEAKDTAGAVTEATVKVEQTEGISEDAIKKCVDIAEQYNTDNSEKKQIENIQVSYTDDSKAIVPPAAFDCLKDAGISLEVSKKSSDGTVAYTWDFDANALDETTVTNGINTKIDVFENAEGYADKKVVESLTNPDAKTCVVAFAHDGALPKDTKVTINVGDQYADGTTVYYYHINKETNALELINSVKVQDGMVTLTLSHCSDYVICDKKDCKHEKTEVRNAKEASCTEAGYTGDTYCVDCDTKLKTGEVIAKKAHTSSDWIIDKAATVDAEGSRHKECTVCKTVLEKEAIAKLPKPDPTPQPEVTPDVTVRYTTHVQSIGWQGDENDANKWFVNGSMAGTSG